MQIKLFYHLKKLIRPGRWYTRREWSKHYFTKHILIFSSGSCAFSEPNIYFPSSFKQDLMTLCLMMPGFLAWRHRKALKLVLNDPQLIEEAKQLRRKSKL